MKKIFFFMAFFLASSFLLAQNKEDSLYFVENYTKYEHQIPMRDGVKLFTAVYMPKNASPTQKYPILLTRTPYTVSPYGTTNYPNPSRSMHLLKEGFIMVMQDVRGRYMSEGEFVDVRPHIPNVNPPKKSQKNQNIAVCESSDTYDTIDWLIKNLQNNNGNVGIFGISYPGFYAAMGLVESHPALKAASPQAPIADWWYDDFHHHGAFFMPHFFNFYYSFGQARPKPTPTGNPSFKHGTPDGYKFFLEKLGATGNIDKFYEGKVAFWKDVADHPNYDDFWKARNILPHLRKVAPAVMTVGGLFDAEDLYGPLAIYKEIEKNNPQTYNTLVMGPWFHGQWSRNFMGTVTQIGNISFGEPTEKFYRENMELPFFKKFLKNDNSVKLPEAYIFDTGANKWRTFEKWTPTNVSEKSLFFEPKGKLVFEKSQTPANETFEEFVSDPAKPVPYTEELTTGMTREYMTDDQRFAARRPDVIVYQTEVLTEDITLVGDILANLKVSTSQTDADWIVKLIDVFPDNTTTEKGKEKLNGYQMMVRSEAIRGRFRNSAEKPQPFVPNEATEVRLPLQDVLHTFQKGHRIMVQVQSTWFPLVDRNPQKYVENIYKSKNEDFVKAIHRVFQDGGSFLKIKVLNEK